MADENLLQVLLRRWPIVAGAIVLTLAGAAYYLRTAPPGYTSTARICVRPTSPTVMSDTEAATGADESALFLNTERVVLTSAEVLESALAAGLKDLPAVRAATDPAEYLRKNLSVTLGRRDNVLSVEFEAAAPGEAAIAANAVVDAYIKHHAARRRARADRMIAVLQRDRSGYEAELGKLRSTMLELRRSAGAVALEGQDAPAMRLLQSIKETLTAAHLETVTAQSLYSEAMAAYKGAPKQIAEIERLEKTGGIVVTGDAESANVRSSIAEIEQKIDSLIKLNNWLPSHPQIQGMQVRLEYLRAMYVVATKRRLALAQNREERLREAAKEQEAVARDFAEKSVQYAKLDAEAKRLEKRSDVLDERIRQLQADADAGVMNVQIVEPARAAVRPSKPDKARVYGAGGLAGLLLGAVLALVADHRKTGRFKLPDDIKSALRLPLLGIIPHTRADDTKLALAVASRSAELGDMAEASRAVGAALSLAGYCQGGKRVMVTSASPGEGKSTVVSNLAAALAQSGRRIIVVDANLRRPRQHENMGVAIRPGLCSVLTGEETIEHASQRTAYEGVDLMPAGAVSANPSELLAGPRLREVLDSVKAKYDMVLVDAPACIDGSDTRVLAALCDAVILAVSPSHVSETEAQSAVQSLRNVGAHIIGVVASRVRSQRIAGHFELPIGAETAVDTSGGEAGRRPSAAYQPGQRG